MLLMRPQEGEGLFVAGLLRVHTMNERIGEYLAADESSNR